MGKLDDYTAGRAAGLLMARDIVKKGGLEELEKEIRFRNITGIHTAFTRKELDKASEKIKERTLDTVCILSAATLRDEFGFGKVRLQRFMARMNLKAECLMDDMATWTDYINTIREEVGLEMTIRRND